MKEKIIEIKKSELQYITPGNAADAKEFFNKVIKDQFSNKDAIKAIHKALMKYVNNDNAVYVLRLFGSDSKKNYKNLRRGFLTIYPDGHKMVFCDNTFAMPFAVLKLGGKAYTDEELLHYMNDRTTRFGFGSTKEERELTYYMWNKNKANINLNNYGWYLAHIIPVGMNYSGKNLRDLFDNPSRSDWEESEDKIRRPKNDLTVEELAMLKSHFLRMVHPLNSFLVPKRSLLAYNGNNIGEEDELINLVRDYIMTEFQQEYDELIKAMQGPDKVSTEKTISQIVWGDSESKIKKNKSKIKQQNKNKKRYPKDLYDRNEEEILDNTLKSIGKSAFLKLYPIVKENPNISLAEVYKHYPEFKNYSSNAQKTRLSSTRSIVNQGLDYEAMSNVMLSSRLSKEDRMKAEQFVADLKQS